MADEKKKTSAEASEKKNKAVKSDKGAAPKKGGNIFARAWSAIKKFFKDVKGECKKVVWPDAKTVMKNTGIVLACVVVLGVLIFLIDQGLSWCIKQVIALAQKSAESSAATATVANAVIRFLGF